MGGTRKAMRVHCYHSTRSTGYCYLPPSAWSVETDSHRNQLLLDGGCKRPEGKRQCLNLQKG